MRDLDDRPTETMRGPAPETAAPVGEASRFATLAGATGAALVQRKIARRRVQRQAHTATSEANVQRVAAAGIEGAGAALPHGEAIQRAFGRHDVGGVQAHVGGAATDAARAMGAEAYATGDHVAFAGAPSLHTAAHEAAHVVQQRAGVQLKGGVGQVGDAYEQHADEVADRVVAGRSAEDVLDRMAGSSRAATTATTGTSGGVQRLAVYPGSVTDLEQVGEPHRTEKPFSNDYHLLLENLRCYDDVAGLDVTTKLEQNQVLQAKSLLNTLARHVEIIFASLDDNDRAELPEFFAYVRRLAEAVGRERVARGWNPTSANPLHGDRVRRPTSLRSTPNEDQDPATILDGMPPEDLLHPLFVNKTRQQQLKLIESMNDSNKMKELGSKDRLVIRDERINETDGSRWYHVDVKEQRGYVAQGDVAGSARHDLPLPRLFRREPSVNDIHQGQLGDCFLLSALGSVARHEPAFILEMVVDQGQTASVRFYRNIGNGEFLPQWITVEKSVVMGSNGEPRFADEPWVGVVEKAYAVWKGEGLYGRITGGEREPALQHLLGQKATSVSGSTLQGSSLAAHFHQVLVEEPNRAATLGTKGNFKNREPHPQLYPNHAYELVGAAPGALILRNPHGTVRKNVASKFVLADALVDKHFEHGSHTEAQVKVPDPDHSDPQALVEEPIGAHDYRDVAGVVRIVTDVTRTLPDRLRALAYIAHLAISQPPDAPDEAAQAFLHRLVARPDEVLAPLDPHAVAIRNAARAHQ